MCKIVGFSKLELTKPRLNNLLCNVRDCMLGMRQEDGFGFACNSKDTGLYFERYVNPIDFQGINPNEHLSNYGPLLDVIDFEYSQSGIFTGLNGPLIIHGRTSTNDICVENTHPIVKAGIALIHNGVVNYTGPKRECLTTCDSEHILNAFVYGKGFQEWSQHFSGWAAIMALEEEGSLTIARDDTAPLVVARLNNGSFVFASCKELITCVAMSLKQRVSTYTVQRSTIIRFEVNGKVNISSTPQMKSAALSTRKCFGFEQSEYTKWWLNAAHSNPKK